MEIGSRGENVLLHVVEEHVPDTDLVTMHHAQVPFQKKLNLATRKFVRITSDPSADHGPSGQAAVELVVKTAGSDKDLEHV